MQGITQEPQDLHERGDRDRDRCAHERAWFICFRQGIGVVSCAGGGNLHSKELLYYYPCIQINDGCFHGISLVVVMYLVTLLQLSFHIIP